MTIDDLLRLRDLTDPAEGPHAIQLTVAALEDALTDHWGVPVHRDSGHRVVSIADNYDRLRYRPDAITRDRRYSHYLDDAWMLRSHTTARIPALLAALATDALATDALTTDAIATDALATDALATDALATAGGRAEILLSVPGICFRRDAIGRRHVGEPHQIDLWRIRRHGTPLTEDDLEAMVGLVVGTVLPGHRWYTVPNTHPYTLAGREIYVVADGSDVEIGECGLAHPEVLAGSGLSPDSSGLAMGLGLDRLTMLAKGIDDIRLLRTTDPRVIAQMHDLSPYVPVSAMPAARRDLSLAVPHELDAELLGDRIRAILGPGASAIEEVSVLSETPYSDLPPTARERMGLRPGQKNLLVRLVLRDLHRTLTAAQANALRDRVYAGLHEGSAYEWTAATR